MGSEKPWTDESILRELYHEEELSQREVAEELGCSRMTIVNWMDRHDIEVRDRGEATRMGLISGEPWTDQDRLEQLYHEDGLSTRQIAEEFDTTKTTILRWMEHHGIERDTPKRNLPGEGDRPWQDKSVLHELYVDQKLSSREIGDKLGCHSQTVRYWLDKHDIEVRDMRSAMNRGLKKQPVHFSTTQAGYEKWQTASSGERATVPIHRLVAVAEWGVEEVADKQVHHKNEIKWDNRPENLELLTHSEHMELHAERRFRDGDKSWMESVD